MEDIDDVMSDVWNWLNEDEREDDIFDIGHDFPADIGEMPEEDLQGDFLPYNEWYKQVSDHIEKLTSFAHSIDTVGFDNWWHDWYQDGLSPEEAALMGLKEEILLEDE